MGYEPISYDRDTNALYVRLSGASVARTTSLDDFRMIDYSADGAVVGVEFIDVTAGVDLEDVPFHQKIEDIIGQSGLDIKLFA